MIIALTAELVAVKFGLRSSFLDMIHGAIPIVISNSNATMAVTTKSQPDGRVYYIAHNCNPGISKAYKRTRLLLQAIPTHKIDAHEEGGTAQNRSTYVLLSTPGNNESVRCNGDLANGLNVHW